MDAFSFRTQRRPPNGQQLAVQCSPNGSSPDGTAHLNCDSPKKVGADVVVNDDSPTIATHQLIMIIGSSRYALDISTKSTKLQPSRAEVFVALRFAC